MRRISKLMKQLHVPSSAQLDRKIHDEISGALLKTQIETSPDMPPALLWTILRHIAPLVGCLLLGFALGGWFFRHTAEVYTPGVTTPIVRQAEFQQEAPAQADTSEFWSYRRLYERAVKITPERSIRMIWDSPVTKPKLGDAI